MPHFCYYGHTMFKGLSKEQQMAMLVVPILLFGVLGVSYSAVYNRNLTERADESDETRESENRDTEKQHMFSLEQRGADVQNSESAQKTKHLIQQAVEDNNFEAFMQAVSDTPFGEVMTKEAFSILVEAHRLHKARDYHAIEHLISSNSLLPPANDLT